MNSPEAKHKAAFPPKWLKFLLGCLVVIGVLLSVGLQIKAQVDTRTAQASTATMAADIKRMCDTNGTLLVDDRDVCAKAAQVKADPTQPIPGPKGDKGDDGPRGLPGKDGADGKDSTVPGPTGKTGAAGLAGDDGADAAASTVPGPQGATGKAGADSTIPGPAGKDGTPGAAGKDGAPGAPGSAGATGKGVTSVECVGEGNSSYWLITYTDGTTNQSTGPCRLTAAEPTPTPTP